MGETVNPKIEMPITFMGKVIEVIGLLLLLAFWVYTLFNFKQLPEIIPTHFRTNGVVDGYGNKWGIISLPVVATLMYLGLTMAARYPHKMNYLATITDANAARQYAVVIKMFRVLKIAVVALFFLMAFESVQLALGLPDIFGKWFLLIAFSLLFVPIFFFLILSAKNA